MPAGIRCAVELYVAPNGKSPLVEWLESIKDPGVVQRIWQGIDRFELGNFGDCKPVKGKAGLWEARLFFGAGYRLYFALEEPNVVLLLCGGTKSTQRRDIVQAEGYCAAHRRDQG